MTMFHATIRHHSISRARAIVIEGDLTQAKRAASREFGGDMQEYSICIFSAMPDGTLNRDDLVSARKIGGKRWIDTPADQRNQW